jgi:hypothetical protein
MMPLQVFMGKGLAKWVEDHEQEDAPRRPDGGGGWNIKRGIGRNQHSELVIHNRDGKISQCDSHGNDPCPPRDKK